MKNTLTKKQVEALSHRSPHESSIPYLFSNFVDLRSISELELDIAIKKQLIHLIENGYQGDGLVQVIRNFEIIKIKTLKLSKYIKDGRVSELNKKIAICGFRDISYGFLRENPVFRKFN